MRGEMTKGPGKKKRGKAILRESVVPLFLMGGAFAEELSPRPNIILLFADDLGWTDPGSFGSSFYETPNLDRLSREGMRFTDAYSAAPNCAPSRACLITGQYTPRHGVYTVGSRHRFDRGMTDFAGRPHDGPNWDDHLLLPFENAQGIGTERETIGTALQKAGYRTGYFGKWHVGYGGSIPIGGFPEEVRGFDVRMLSAGRHYNIRVWPDPEEPIAPDVYLSDYLTDHALDFIQANQDRPFFLFLSDFLVHLPAQAPEELIEKYRNKPSAGGHRDPVYAAMVESYDISVGRILDRLDELGLRENTLVFFTSDNGGDHRTSNLPLRAAKGSFYEGGIRVPAIARWPGKIQPGSVSDVPVCGIDLFPTFAAISGSPVNRETYLLDGEDLTPLFQGKKHALRERDLFWYFPGYLPGRQTPSAVIRSGDYKLMHFFEDDRVELYHLRDDIGETTNLSGSLPEKAGELKKRLDLWRDRTGAEIPPRNPKFE